MATLEDFIRTGHLGPVILGMSPMDALTTLGPADDTSRKTNPLLLKYGGVQLSFWKSSKEQIQQLREIVLAYQPESEPLPAELAFKDWNPAGAPTEQEFRAFVEQIEYPPIHVVEGPGDKAILFPSGVSALISEGKLHSIRLQQKENKASPQAPVIDEREPSIDQIGGMLIEAEHTAEAQAYRAALLIGWAALEATLRRMAHQEGRLTSRAGVQPAILLRELYASRRLSPDEHGFLEMLRQERMAAAHGLVSSKPDAQLVTRLIEITAKMLDRLQS